MRHERDRQVEVEGLAEQLAGLGQIGGPGAAALVDLAEPLRLGGDRDPPGDQFGQLPGACGVGAPAQDEPDGAVQAGRGGERHVESTPGRDGAVGRGVTDPRQLAGPGAVATVDLDDDGRRVDQITQPSRQFPDQVDGIEATGQGRRHVQQPAGLLGRGPGALVFGCRGRRRLGGGSRSPGDGEPHRVLAVGAVPGAPGRGQLRDEGQTAAVGGRPAVARPRLGQVQLQRARCRGR